MTGAQSRNLHAQRLMCFMRLVFGLCSSCLGPNFLNWHKTKWFHFCADNLFYPKEHNFKWEELSGRTISLFTQTLVGIVKWNALQKLAGLVIAYYNRFLCFWPIDLKHSGIMQIDNGDILSNNVAENSGNFGDPLAVRYLTCFKELYSLYCLTDACDYIN